MSATPRHCPNMGIDCGFPDCVYDVPECAEANAEQPRDEGDDYPIAPATEPPLDSRAVGDLELLRGTEGAPAPPSARGPFSPRTLAPLFADDIFKGSK